VLTAFIRSHAPWPPRLPGQYRATAPIDEVPELQVWAADVQASLTVLGRGGFASPAEGQGNPLDLHAVDLRHANLRGAHLEGANLDDAHFEGALANRRTTWPAGFDLRAAGVIVEADDDAANGP
jgi:hypothetical protein